MVKKVILSIFIILGFTRIENLKGNPTGLDGGHEIFFNAWWAEQAFSDNLDNKSEVSTEVDKLVQKWQLDIRLPFSFIYGGQHSSSFINTWDRTIQNEIIDKTKRRRTLVLTDPQTGLEVRAVCTIFTDSPGVDWTLYFTNTGTQDTPIIEQVKALNVLVIPDSSSESLPMLHRSRGSNNRSDDWMEFEQKIKKGERIEFAPIDGWPSQGANPFFNLEWDDGGVITAIGWTCQWVASIEHTDNGSLSIQAGMEFMRLKLHPGESIRSPRILQLYWFGDHGFRSYNLFRQTMLNHIMPRINGELVLPPIAYTTSAIRELNMTTEAIQFDYLEAMKGLGFEFYWLDAYWIKKGWPRGIGEFGFPIERVPDPERFPRGIKPIGDAVKKENLGFILWFSPEMVWENTHLVMDHPEWVIMRPGHYAGTLNLGIREAREYMTKYLFTVIKEYQVDCYRTDNGPKLIDLHYHERNTPDRLGMTEIRNVEGEYRMWDDILARFPHLFIDNCCGGTMRQDLETLSRAISLWNTDATGPYITVGNINQVSLQNQMMSANINRYIPYSICGTMGTTPYAIRSGFNGGLCYMDDIRLPHHKRDLDLINKGLRQWPLPEIDKLEEFTDRKREQLKKGIAEGKRIRKYYLGNFYPHSGANLDARDWCVIQYHRPIENDGIILAFRRHESPFTRYISNLCEIDPQANYKVTQSLTFKQSRPSIIRGIDLKNLNLEIADCPGSLLVEYSQEDHEHTSIQNEDSIESARSWEFNDWNDNEGWTIPEAINGGILGGSIWLMIHPELKNLLPVSWKHQVWGPNLKYDLESPKRLAISAAQFNMIRIRLRNLSPETDGYVFWRTANNPEADAGRVRFTMRPDCNKWQEIVCHLDGLWQGIIDQIRIRPAQMWWRGDIWIDRITITKGDPKPLIPRQDVYSDAVVPHINLPRIPQQDFQDAFKVLDECLVVDVPMHGFNYPFMAPGGAYGENWWQLDGSLNVAGAKWVNQKHVEDVMRGFAEVQAQNPDGRIDLWGGSPMRGQVADVSSIPRYFEAAYDVARRSDDSSLHELIYQTMKQYLHYWFSPVKCDKQSGLITAVFEETLSEPHLNPGILAPVDLNVSVAIGCYNASLLAEYLGKISESKELTQRFEQLCRNINRYFWNEDQGVYYNYNVKEGRQHLRLLCTTFDPMRLKIAPADRIERLLTKLLKPTLFYWDSRPVTSIGRTEPDYVEAMGPYDGSAWYGDIWTMRNMPIIAGLEDGGYHDLAAELNWSTIKTFNANFCEYVVPSTGSGEGVQRYGWTASQYIQAVIEHLFGIDYDRFQKRLRIVPHVPDELKDQRISINSLIIPAEQDVRLNLTIDQTSSTQVNIDVKISGPLPIGDLEVLLPIDIMKLVQVKNRQGEEIPVVRDVKDMSNVAGVRLPMKNLIQLRFIRR